MKKQIYLNMVMLLMIIAISVAWMITYSSRGEIVDYDRTLIVTAIDNIEVKLYRLVDSEYVLVTDPTLQISALAPGDVEQFKFDIKNDNDNLAHMQIVFSKIAGDLDILGNKITIGSTSPSSHIYNLSTDLTELANGDKSLSFDKNFTVDAGKTVSLYWYISLDSKATNEVVEKIFTIDSINFLKP